MEDLKLNSKHDFEKIFIGDIPLIDLRAPVEFNLGAFPNAVNLPLMTDEERKKVGICYKKEGQEAALALGNKLVSGDIRESRIAVWQRFVEQNPAGYLYCFRGGLRSKIAQQWLALKEVDYPLIQGGYKAMRQYLMTQLIELSTSFNFVIIGGRTGTRKTDLILNKGNAIDLEGRANHRGSSFGRRIGGQPTVINFENSLAIDLLKLKSKYATLLLEDEGVTIGSCSVPEALRQQINTSPIYIVEATVEERVSNILNDYVVTLSKEYIDEDAEQGWENYRQSMFSALQRIKKRLGGERYSRLYQLMDSAFTDNNIIANGDLHRSWIHYLLVEYYDPMYDFQLTKKLQRIVVIGQWDEISDAVNHISK